MGDELGFSVACSRAYIPLLRGWLESIKLFAPDAPILMMVDGPMDTKPFEKKYGVIVMRRADIKDVGLRKTCSGYGTKPVAFWEAPFKYVFHVDVDAVLWGDIRSNLPIGDWDLIHNEPHEDITDFIQKNQYFDPAKIFKYVPEFDWQGCPFFQAGVICVKTGSLDLDEYLRMVELQIKYPDIFINGDQGMLNILIFRAMKAGKLKVNQAHLQSCVPVLPRSELEVRFKIKDGNPVLWKKPTVIHWAGQKPYTTNPDVFSAPMDLFRLSGMFKAGLPHWMPATTALRADEYMYRDVPKHILNAKKCIKKMVGRK